MKIESDKIEIFSGVRHGKTLGSPIASRSTIEISSIGTEIMSSEKLEVEPKNPRIVTRPRPGHADLAGGQKFRNPRFARHSRTRFGKRNRRPSCLRRISQTTSENFGIEIKSHVIKLGQVPEKPSKKHGRKFPRLTKDSPLNCADEKFENQMIELIDKAKDERRHARRNF